MRPVDLQPGAPHAFFNSTFDNLTGAPLLVIGDYTWNAAPGDATYLYFANGQAWGGNAWPPMPVQVPNNGTTHLAVATVVAVNALGMVNRDNTGNVTINAQVLTVQVDTPATRRRRIRVVVPAGEASDFVRAWEDGNWNGAAPAAIPVGVKDDVRAEVRYRDTVPNVPAPAGTFYGYRGAIRDLETTLGGYCNYCEAKRQDGPTLDVEHRLAKGTYISELLRWDNYLLGCVICNSRFKGKQPTRVFGITNAIAAYYGAAGVVYAGGNASPVIPPGPNVIPYYDMRLACEEYQCWPSNDDGGAGPPVPAANPANPTNYSLLCYQYRLREYDVLGAVVGWVPAADAVHLDNNAIGDGPNNTVQANVWDSALLPPALRMMYVRVEVDPRNPNTTNVNFDARKLAAATNTIAMAGLNGIANAFGDRRMVQRTHAWLAAIQMLRLLRDQAATLNRWRNNRVFNYLFGGPPSPNFDTDHWNLVASAAEGGYYSVWLTVFKAYAVANNFAPNNLASSLATLLNARAAANMMFRYKGTNLANSVTNMIPNL